MRPPPGRFIENIWGEIENLASNQMEPPVKIIKTFEKKYGPLDKILYGEDIVELMKIELQTNKEFRRIKKTNARLSEEYNKSPILEFMYSDRLDDKEKRRKSSVMIDINKIAKNPAFDSVSEETEQDEDDKSGFKK